MSMSLVMEDVTKHFGGVTAVNGVSFTVEPRTVTTILGPNGAGKTTLFNLITGVLPLTSGQITADGTDITDWPTYEVARFGLARTFQKLRLFDNLTAQQNVSVSAHSIGKVGWLQAVFGSRAYRDEITEAGRRADELLRLVGLVGKADAMPGELPHGEQRLLEIARALALEPKILLLDEPMAGLNDAECDAVGRVVSTLRDQGMTVLMIEHHVDAALGVSDHAVVIDFGKRIFDGSPAECRKDHAVRKAYLGGLDTEEEGV
jgi:branched-chain amino acid transport system ATP-binding protein